ncbi:MAG: ABC-type transport auxiliary lipoprotein family protein [bacterium]
MKSMAQDRIVCVICIGLLMSLCFSGAGCIGQMTVPEDHFYTLPEVPPEGGALPITEGTLAVDKLQAHGLYKERSLLYVLSDKPLELQRYYYRHWANSPSYLIQENLLAYLRTGNWAQKVIRYKSGMKADKIIRGQLLRFERIVDKENVSIMASLELQLLNGDSPALPLINNTYSARINAADSSIYATVEAYAKALKQIYDGFINDIKKSSF